MLLGQAESVGAGWRKVDQFVERIRAVTAKDVQRVARQYLTEDNRTVGTLIPVPTQTTGTAHCGSAGKTVIMPRLDYALWRFHDATLVAS